MCPPDTPRRRTRRTSGLYDSDRVSNGQHTSCFLFLVSPSVSHARVSPAEDSGNSSEDSEAEEPPNKKLPPWRVRTETPPLQEEGVVKQEEETEPVAHKMAAEAAAGHLTAEQLSPDGCQEMADSFLLQSEEKGEEPPGDALSPGDLDEGQVVPAGLEVVPTPSSVGSSPPPPLLEESERSAIFTHKVKGRRGGRESPPRISICSSEHTTPPPPPPPHGGLKRPEEPLVVLHCLPSQHLPPDSDTDSATEEEAPEEATQHAASTLNLKASERRQDEALPTRTPPQALGTSPKALALLPLRDLEPRSEELLKAHELPAEGPQGRDGPQGRSAAPGSTSREPQVSSVPAEEPPAVELEPQIGPEALLCYEVDLDDPEDKEKPASTPEHLLLLMEEQAALPLPTLLPQHQVRAFPPAAASCPPAAASCPAPCPQELHPLGKAPEDRAPVAEEQDREAGTSLSTSVHDARGEP